jgi:type I site-specific restriction-modification system R (restriction) subunit
MNRIAMSANHKQLGTLGAGGYIWHTTGSGKTLTSFKTAQLATRLEGNVHSDADKDWRAFTDRNRSEDLEKIIEQEDLKPDETRRFVANAFRDGELKSTGISFAGILPPVSMFDKDNALSKKKSRVLETLRAYFEKYLGV